MPPSRRAVLGSIAATTATTIAGCSGSGSGGSDDLDCQTSASEHGRGDLLDGGATGRTDGSAVHLVVPLDADAVRESGAATVLAYRGDGSLAFEIPVDAADASNADGVEGEYDSPETLGYAQYLGERPLNGRYRLVVRDGSGETLDAVTVSFNCFADGG